MKRCEWNPDDNCPAISTDIKWLGHDYHVSFHEGCQKESVYSVGISANSWHLCADCVQLPRFKGYRTKTNLKTKAKTPLRKIVE